jgi:transcription elongation factor Elf1
MKVLKDNYNERVFECENCESELLVHRDDLIRDINIGETYFICPLCGEKTFVCFPL